MAGFMNTKHLQYEKSQEVPCDMDVIDITWSIYISLDKL